MLPATRNTALSQFDVLRMARDILKCEAEALLKLSGQLPADFYDAVQMILECEGSVIVTGMGKAGWIGQKISASLASTGTRSHFLHPAEAFHGDLGRIGPRDIILALSNSGESSEIVQILPSLGKFNTPVVAITSQANSTLAKFSDLVLDYGKTMEAGHLGLAPSTTTTLMLAVGDALALVCAKQREFRDIDFARFHPGGSLGKKLTLVEDLMRPLEHCRVAEEQETIREVYVRHGGQDRRVGVILIVNRNGQLAGLFTDSDLARMLERQQDRLFDCEICELMTRQPVTVTVGTRTHVAIETLACRNISELPVIDANGKLVGLIDITDVVNVR